MSDLTQTLETILESLYFPLKAVSITNENTRYQYRLALKDFEKFLGRPAVVSDLSDDALNLWMAAMLCGNPQKGIAKLGKITVRERAGRIGALWNWMAKRRMVDTFPTFAKPRAPETSPYALDGKQLQALFASAGRERGLICGIPAWLWCQSYLLFVLNSGERKTAALSVRCEWIDLPNKICLVPPGVRKGGIKAGRYRLWDKTVQMIAACILVDSGRECVWPWDKCDGSYYTMYNRILRDAGIPVTRHTKTHALRVTLSSWVKAFGGDPSAVLGHSDTTTFMRHYNDRRITAQPAPDLTQRFGLDFGG